MSTSIGSRIGIVTGASAGIGEAVARSLVGAGAKIIINARREERLESLVRELGEDRCKAVAGDCADDGVIESMLDAAKERYGDEADLVVVNAGRGLRGSVFDSDTDEWEDMIRTNLLGAARLMRAAAERMAAFDGDWREKPRDIVAVGSNVGKHISPFSSMYGSTKFAVGALAEGLRRELAPKGIRVTLVAPGIVRTEFQESAGYDLRGFGQFMEQVGPVLKADDVARLIEFVVGQPAHVHVNDIVIRPTRQDYP